MQFIRYETTFNFDSSQTAVRRPMLVMSADSARAGEVIAALAVDA